MKPIVTTQQYEEALARIDEVMDELSTHHNEDLEHEMIMLNMTIDRYESALERAS